MSDTLNGIVILLVDEQPACVETVCTFLESGGYTCVLAHSAAQAIDCYKTDERISLVICNLHLPDRGGIELVHALRKTAGKARPLEAIMLSDQADVQTLILALRERFADFYPKPVDLDALLEGVRRQEAVLLERKQDFQHLGGLNQRLQELAGAIDELYQELEKARGEGTHRRVTDVQEGETELPPVFEKLSPRQLEVAKLVSQGMTNYQVACELGITENTVKLYVSQVLRLTQMHNRTQLALALTPKTSPVNQRFTSH